MFEKEAEKHADGIYHYKINVSDYGEDGIINYRYSDVKEAYQKGAGFGYDQCKDKLDIAIEIIEQMKDLFFDCWQERGLNAIKFEQKVNDFLKENK